MLTRYVLPGTVLLGFAALFGWAGRDSFLPSTPVTVVPVLTTRAEAQQAGTPLFQAAGWVEPRPTPVLVPALAEGVVEQLLVVEGQAVKAGDVVARLIGADARLALQTAEADRRLRQAELDAARAALAAAVVLVEKPAHLQAVLAEAEAQLARSETELLDVPFRLRAAEARLRLAKLELESKKSSGNVVPALAVNRAETELTAAEAAAEEHKNCKVRLEREVAALKRRCDALRQRLELKTEETKQLGEARAGVTAAEARLRQAEVAEEAARLRLERMTVRAPCAGRVLALVARPGLRLMGQNLTGHQEASTVVTLYDPGQLQVRADVRHEDLPRVLPGQPVRVETPAVPGGPVEGVVLFATSLADVQKNTLQVKVALTSPPPVLKPDMLVQTTFLAPEDKGAKPAASARLRLLVPRRLVEMSDGESRVWVADRAENKARSRRVTPGQAEGDLVEVVEGLNAADKLIDGGREGLRDGQRIRVTGEEADTGTAAPATKGGVPLPRLPGGHDGH